MKNMKHLIAAVLIACGCIYASQAYASVCFLPSGDCGDSDVNPDDYIPDADALKTKCAEAGYTVAKSDCVDPQKIGDFCPYDNKWVICCSPEFTNECDSTNEIAERCGNLKKCVCPDKFDYYESGDNCIRLSSGSSYTNARGDHNKGICYLREYKNDAITTTSLYQGCLCNATTYPRTPEICQQKGMKPGGIMCQDAPDGGEHYSKCVCEQTTRKSSCSYGIPNNATTCTDEDGLQYVSECCQCNQATYPYDTLPSEVKTYVKCTTERSCSGGSSERYRATSCNSGYTLNDAGKCVKETCGNAIKELLKATSDTTHGLLTTTKVIDGNGNTSNAKKAIVADSVTITTASTNGSSSYTTTYCTRRECKNSGAHPDLIDAPECFCTNCGVWQYNPNYGFGGGYYGSGWNNSDGWNFTPIYGLECKELKNPQQQPNIRYGCNKNGNGNGSQEMTAVCVETRDETTTTPQAKGLVGSEATEYISASEYLKKFGDDPIADNAKNNCSGMPIITYKASTFPSNDSANISSTITFKGVGLNFPSTVSIYRTVNIDNGALTVDGTLNDHGSLSLDGEGEVNISGILNIHNKFSASGYSFNSDSSYFGRGTLVDISPKTISNSITLGDGQTFAVGNFQIGGDKDTYAARTSIIDYNNRNNKCESQTGVSLLGKADNLNKTFSFSGPSTDNRAGVETNLQLGWVGSNTYRARSVKMRLSGALDWYLYNPNSSNTKYSIGLTPGSNITADSYGYGNYARIVKGSHSYIKQCSMVSQIYYERETHHNLGACRCTRITGDGGERIMDDLSFYLSCKYSGTGTTSRTDSYSSTQTVCRSNNSKCEKRKSYVTSGCMVTFEKCSTGSTPDTINMLTCEEADY
ncbi:MAG: hypothetical protein Q4D11_01125 [Rhodospirillales bacterium]|nr:hypothetical protein [Rhodospirillales bacterium]